MTEKENICENCGKEIKVMAFKSDPFCSDQCRKQLGLDPKGAYSGRTA